MPGWLLAAHGADRRSMRLETPSAHVVALAERDVAQDDRRVQAAVEMRDAVGLVAHRAAAIEQDQMFWLRSTVNSRLMSRCAWPSLSQSTAAVIFAAILRSRSNSPPVRAAARVSGPSRPAVPPRERSKRRTARIRGTPARRFERTPFDASQRPSKLAYADRGRLFSTAPLRLEMICRRVTFHGPARVSRPARWSGG